MTENHVSKSRESAWASLLQSAIVLAVRWLASYHALDTYLPKLVRAGHRVAICDQLEEPKGSAKVVEMVEPVSKKRSSKKASQEEMFTKA